MVKTQVKGGVWKNTEDEVLKAAVMKYGLNQWARISSLLVRKTPKQVKARWYEWLDPAIKKVEWSREEDEKLLHLAKLFPTQWRTIAPIVGRTAGQCLERYEALLDEAQGESARYDPQDDPRRLRPGEIDPNPELKPARPDPIDMDEDEKEMLSEARARLANTKGKKAKRKARERQLEEARRLATLQKRRELKSAGIAPPPPRTNRKRRGIDLTEGTPFERKAPEGPFDPSEDPDVAKPSLAGVDIEMLKRAGAQNRNNPAALREQARQDERRRKRRKEDSLPSALESLYRSAEAGPAIERKVLELPAPQVSDRELEEIAKLGSVSESGDLESGSATDVLLPSAEPLPLPAPQRTPRVSLNVDGEDEFTALSRISVATPNPLVGTPGRLVSGTPSLRTPLRRGTPAREAAGRRRTELASLKVSLANLPPPSGEVSFEVVTDDVVVEDDDEEALPEMEEDAADRRKREEIEESKRIEADLARRSTVLRHNLPRPSLPNSDVSSSRVSEKNLVRMADDLIREEVARSVHFDAWKYPLSRRGAVEPIEYEELDAEVMHRSQSLIDAEMMGVVEDAAAFASAWRDSQSFFVVDSHSGDIVASRALPAKRKMVIEEQQASKLLCDTEFLKKKEEKAQSRVDRMTHGYQKKCVASSEKISKLVEEIGRARLELACFESLKRDEDRAIPARRDALIAQLRDLKNRESLLQTRYAQLVSIRESDNKQ